MLYSLTPGLVMHYGSGHVSISPQREVMHYGTQTTQNVAPMVREVLCRRSAEKVILLPRMLYPGR